MINVTATILNLLICFCQVELVQKMIDGVNTLWKEDKELMANNRNEVEDLICYICEDIMQEAVLIPCCIKNSCDPCSQIMLLHHAGCEFCGAKIEKKDLLPNRFLRKKIIHYKSGNFN